MIQNTGTSVKAEGTPLVKKVAHQAELQAKKLFSLSFSI
jgi:hypothetical protein